MVVVSRLFCREIDRSYDGDDNVAAAADNDNDDDVGTLSELVIIGASRVVLPISADD